MSNHFFTIADVVGRGMVVEAVANHKIHKQTYSLHKHSHWCQNGKHRWTVFTSVPHCPHQHTEQRTISGLAICPVNVSCPSHMLGITNSNEQS